jgi:hypothetical protein
MTDLSEIARRYIDVWNEREAETRRKAVSGLWGDDGRYTDPLADVTGAAGIDALIGGVQEQFAGHVFRLGGPVDTHHDIARFTWELVPEGGDGTVDPVVAGFDVIVAGSDGRLRHVYGFLDKVPA